MKRSEFINNFNDGFYDVYDIYNLMVNEGVDYEIYDRDYAYEEIERIAIQKIENNGWRSAKFFLEEIENDAPFYYMGDYNDDIEAIWDMNDMYSYFLDRMDLEDYWDVEEDNEIEEEVNEATVNEVAEEIEKEGDEGKKSMSIIELFDLG